MPTSVAWERARVELEIEERRRKAEGMDAAPALWEPYPDSPQERAIYSPADITGYGGQAGGGKTDFLLGLASTHHRRSIIFRREFSNLKGLVRRSRELFTGHGRFNGHDLIWRGLPGDRDVEFGAAQHEDDVRKYQGQPHDLIGIDEAPHFTESQVWFLMGWNRTTTPGQRCRVAMTFNPPTKASERWITKFFAPWLDRKHADPAIPGELRWYARIDGEDMARPDGSHFEHTNAAGVTETIRPLSRTFFPAKLADNPILAATNYAATLQSMPEPLRSQLLYGDFDAGVEDHAWQLIPTRWVEAAMERWRKAGGDRYEPRVPLTCVGFDVAHGGKDKTVFAPRWGDWYARLSSYPGRETPDGQTAANLAYQLWRFGAYYNVDVIGYGASAHERLSDQPPAGYGVPAYPINFAERSDYKDRSGKYKMVNKRAEAYWRLRDELDPENGSTLCLPDDPELLSDLTAGNYEITAGGIKVEPKEDIAKRLGRSPDKGDAVVLALLPKSSRSLTPGRNPVAGYRG